jgi:CelD/BcsL family acetyltransferase involved in cellulose biosynthesis
MSDIHILRSTAELEALVPAWRALWLKDPDGTPFQHPAWLIPWWRQFGQPDLRAVTISDNGELIGLIPLYILADPQTRIRQLLLLGAGTSDYLDGIFAPACTAGHILEAFRLLREEPGWDEAILTQLRGPSKLLPALTSTGNTVTAEACSRLPAVPIAQLPRKLRQNVQYNRNRASRSGELRYEMADRCNCLKFFDRLLDMHSIRWRERGEPGVLSDPRVVAWHREAIPALAEHGLLHLSELWLEGEVLAAMYGLIDPPERAQRTLYVYLPSFSTRHATLSPGTLVLAHAIEHAAVDGVHTVDFLRGDEPYKRLWHAQFVPTQGLVIPRTETSATSLVRAA